MKIRPEVRNFLASLNGPNVEVIHFSFDEARDYKKEWFEKYVPVDMQGDPLYSGCLSPQGILWNAFNRKRGITDFLEGDEAKVAFNDQIKKDVILVDNIAREAAAYRIKGEVRITADDLEVLVDVIVTDADFNWTFAKTHEDGWFGPYFHKRK